MANLINGLGGIAGFGENILSRNDDGSTQQINITSIFENGLNFFGSVYTSLYVNNNGSVTFEGPRSSFTPTVITATSNNPEITPFFADVDTRIRTSDIGEEEPAGLTPTPGGNSTGSDLVYYDLDTVNDRFIVTWDDVGYFSASTEKLNAFQIILSDQGNGDFDIQFRYEEINWTTGDASDGSDGLGGTVARAGWTAGSGDPAEYYELDASGNQDAILSLDEVPGNQSAIGFWEWRVRNGEVVVHDDDIEAPSGPTGCSMGDPHIVAFDGFAYDFQAAGEFILTRDTRPGGIEVQVRHEPWHNSNTVTVNTAAATLLDGHRVMFDASDNNLLTVDGQVSTIEDGEYISVGTGRIYRDGNEYTVIYPGTDGTVNDGDEQLVVKDRGDYIDLEVRLTDASGTFEGLLGNADGNAANDLPSTLSYANLYGDYRSDWLILDENDSLFTYDPGESPASFFIESFPEGIVTLDTLDPALRAAAEEAVLQAGLEPGTANFNNAVLDFALTNDDSFIESADEAVQVDDGNVVEIEEGITFNENDDVVFPQFASADILGAADGDDIYILSPSLLTAGRSFTISDPVGNDTIQLAEGLAIRSSQVTETALRLTFQNNSSVTVLDADEFTYDVGGNLSAGENNADVTFTTFVEDTLGVTIPSTGIAYGSAVNIGDTVLPALPVVSADDLFSAVQFTSPGIIGSGSGNDTYLLSNSLISAGMDVMISDVQGNNSIQLANGLAIENSRVTNSALQLNLENGATITVLDADEFTYEPGGNRSAGIDNADISFSEFVQSILGTSVPDSGTNAGGPVIIGEDNFNPIAIPIGSTGTFNGTMAEDEFRFDAEGALDSIHTTQVTINNFNLSGDQLEFDLPSAIGNTTLADLAGSQNINVQTDPFNGSTLVNFGLNEEGILVTLTLAGVTDYSLVQVEVV